MGKAAALVPYNQSSAGPADPEVALVVVPIEPELPVHCIIAGDCTNRLQGMTSSSTLYCCNYVQVTDYILTDMGWSITQYTLSYVFHDHECTYLMYILRNMWHTVYMPIALSKCTACLIACTYIACLYTVCAAHEA